MAEVRFCVLDPAQTDCLVAQMSVACATVGGTPNNFIMFIVSSFMLDHVGVLSVCVGAHESERERERKRERESRHMASPLLKDVYHVCVKLGKFSIA